MIPIKDFFLSNGLRVVVSENHNVQSAVLDIIYKVGSRDDFEKNKGIAHLLEHLMFCGSKNVKNFDAELQNVGGSNNAYTNLDVTNYYCSVPHVNIETAFWLESDRMFDLTLSEYSVEIQKNVVTEELKESYYGTPYSDFYLHLLPTIYEKNHPYHFPTIGFEEHIANTTRQDVFNFHNLFYRPENAILVVAGNVDFEDIKKLSEKYFARSYPKISNPRKDFLQKKSDFINIPEKVIKKKVPLECIFFIYKTSSRFDKNYLPTLILGEMLDCGKSSFLYSKLVDEKKVFSSLSVEFDNCELEGNFIITGLVNKGIEIDWAEKELSLEIENFVANISEKELLKVKNNLKMGYLCDSLDLSNCADLLANSFVVNDANYVNEYINLIENIKILKIQELAVQIFDVRNKIIFKYKKL